MNSLTLRLRIPSAIPSHGQEREVTVRSSEGRTALENTS